MPELPTAAILDDARGRRRLAKIIAVAHALTALLILTGRRLTLPTDR